MQPKLSKFESDVCHLLDSKISTKYIINYFQKPPKSIYNAISRIRKKKKLFNSKERARIGGVSKTSSRAKRAINRDITRSPKKTNKRLLEENSLEISNRTLQRVLKDEGWSINISSKKAFLNAKKAKNRLAWAKNKLKELDNIDFRKIIFSDESGIQRNRGAQSEYMRKRGN